MTPCFLDEILTGFILGSFFRIEVGPTSGVNNESMFSLDMNEGNERVTVEKERRILFESKMDVSANKHKLRTSRSVDSVTSGGPTRTEAPGPGRCRCSWGGGRSLFSFGGVPETPTRRRDPGRTGPRKRTRDTGARTLL